MPEIDDFQHWSISGEYGNGFFLGCPDCDWEHQHPFVSASLRELKSIADKHVEEAHP